MTASPSDRTPADPGVGNQLARSAPPEVVRHLAFALRGHIHRLKKQGLYVPECVEELSTFLADYVKSSQIAPISAPDPRAGHHAPVSAEIVLTKSEAADRLRVSIRTIDRLVAQGQLAKVHVAGSARFRLQDLTAYVDGLNEPSSADSPLSKRRPHPS